MAQPAAYDNSAESEPSIGILEKVKDGWTGQRALDLLPETNGPRIEVFRGSVIVAPHAGIDHQTIARNQNRRKDVIDRPVEYAAAGVPWFMRVDFRNRVPAVVLQELIDGEYRPVVAAAAGTAFVMKEPFEFSTDPADLLDE